MNCNHPVFNVIEVYIELDGEVIDINAPDQKYYEFKNNPRSTLTFKQRCVNCRAIELKVQKNPTVKV